MLAWAPALLGPFQFDDHGVIVRDASVHGLAAAFDALGGGLRPVLRASYAASWALGLGAVGFHATNLGVHLLNTALVVRLYALARGEGGRWGGGPPSAGALVAGGLFALHPLHTEAVTYVSGRSVSLMTTFVLLALVGYAASARPGGPRSGRWLAPLAFAAALLTKEAAATLPVGLLLWELLVTRAPWREAARRLAPWALLLVGAALAALAHDPTYRLLLGMVGQRDLGSSLVHQLEGVAWLVVRWVRIDRLSIDPGMGLVPPDPLGVGVGALAVLALLGLALTQRRARPLLAFGAAWFLLQAFLPYLLLPRVDVLNERHAYLADIGLCLAAGAWLGAQAPTRDGRAALAALAFALALGTAARNLDYRSERALWTATVRASPGNPRAHNNLGVILEREGRGAEAEAAYARALELRPGFAAARENLERVRGVGR